ncbi:MAG: flippase-like domain-containing protein [Candidatus Eisenbacteria bacterium]|nr:flippase-like domain-containing protein [Candidatus Eisenbacteria bacterium]
MSGHDEERADSAQLEAKIKKRSWGRWALLLLVTLVVFVLLGTKLDYAKVGSVLGAADPFLLFVGLLITATFPVFSALRWQRVMNGLGHQLAFGEAFELIMAAWPMGTLTPSKAGDVVKAYYLRNRIPIRTTLGSVLAERALDVLVLLALALFGCVLFQRWDLALLAGGGLLAGLVGITVLLTVRLPLPAKLQDKVDGVLEALRVVGRSPRLLSEVLLLTVINWMASVVQVVVCYKALGVVVPLTFTTGAVPLAIFVGLLPLTLSGMGTRDSAFIALFGTLGVAAEVSLGVGLLYSLYGYWLPALAGLPFMKRVLGRG